MKLKDIPNLNIGDCIYYKCNGIGDSQCIECGGNIVREIVEINEEYARLIYPLEKIPLCEMGMLKSLPHGMLSKMYLDDDYDEIWII